MGITSETLVNGTARRAPISHRQRRALRSLTALGLFFFVLTWCLDGAFTAMRAVPIIEGIAAFFADRLTGSRIVPPAFVWGAGFAVHLLFSFGQYHLWRLQARLLVILGLLFAALNIIASVLGVRDILVWNRVDLPPTSLYAWSVVGGVASALLPEPVITALLLAWRKM